MQHAMELYINIILFVCVGVEIYIFTKCEVKHLENS